MLYVKAIKSIYSVWATFVLVPYTFGGKTVTAVSFEKELRLDFERSFIEFLLNPFFLNSNPQVIKISLNSPSNPQHTPLLIFLPTDKIRQINIHNEFVEIKVKHIRIGSTEIINPRVSR